MQEISKVSLFLFSFLAYFDGLAGWGKGSKLIYKNFATLYFIFVADSSESELGMLEMIQIFVVKEFVCSLYLSFSVVRKLSISVLLRFVSWIWFLIGIKPTRFWMRL